MTHQIQSSTNGPSPVRPSLRYIAVLLGGALLILVVGAVLRPGAEGVSTVATSELATLPERSQRRELRDIAEYVSQRAASLASSVVYLPASRASGVVLGKDSVLSAALPPRPPAVLVSQSPGDSSVSPPRGTVDDLSPHWALVVARAPDGRVLQLAGLTGGVVPVLCDELALHELAFGAPVPEAFAGGGVFDLDGNLLALAMPCAGHVALVPLADVATALERQASVAFRLWTLLGVRVAPIDSARAEARGADAGLVVTETLAGGPADLAGLWPGDVIVGTAAGPVAIATDLEPVLSGSATKRLEFTGGRGGVILRVAPDSAPSVRRAIVESDPPDGPIVGMVATGSRAGRAGLRAGDRIVQIGQVRWPTTAAVSRALAGGRAQFVVYERAGRRRGLMLP